MVTKKSAGPARTASAPVKTATAAVKKTATEKTAPEKTAASATKTAPAQKAPATKKASATKKAAAKKPAKKAPAGKSAARKATVPATKAATKTSATKTSARRTPAGKTSAAKTRPAKAPQATAPGELMVRPGEEPWSPAEVARARAELGAEADRLRAEILLSEDAVSGLMRDSGDGAGDDQADVGSKTISREHEMSLAENTREMLAQTRHALERLDDGTYGRCESCGQPIGKARMQAFPRATLCVECKQRTERR